MKEAAMSAAALLGLLAFAGVYNQNQVSRARRDVTSDDSADNYDDTNNALGINDIANMTAENWAQIQLELGIMEDELLPFEIDSDDITGKQAGGDDDDDEDDSEENEGGIVIEGRARRRKPNRGAKGVSITRFKIKDVPKLHAKMNEAYTFRQGTLLKNFVADSNIFPAQRLPTELLDDEGKAAAHVDADGNYPDYAGNGKTAPSVQKFLNEFGYNEAGTNLFAEGGAQMWFLVPAAVPLMSKDEAGHLGDYANYWNFIQGWKTAFDATQGRAGNTLRVSVGLYHKGAVYSPRGTLYRAGRFPWSRIKNFYLRPRTTTAMPYLIPTAESLLSWIPRFGASSASVGQDCWTIWFHQDFAADANQLLLTDQFASLDQLYQLCNVMHVFVGFDQSSADAQAYAAALVPGLQAKVSKDPEFSGVFFVNDLAEVNGEELRQSVNKYMTMIKGRAGCRVVESGYIPPPSMSDATSFPGGTEVTYAEVAQAAAATAGAVIEMTQPDYEATEAATVRAFVEQEPTEAPKIPEIDSCCGHDLFSSTPYDSELRTCCDDGQPKAFSDDGSDPCMADLGDFVY